MAAVQRSTVMLRVNAYMKPAIVRRPLRSNKKGFLPNLSARIPSTKLLMAAMNEVTVNRKPIVSGSTPSFDK